MNTVSLSISQFTFNAKQNMTTVIPILKFEDFSYDYIRKISYDSLDSNALSHFKIGQTIFKRWWNKEKCPHEAYYVRKPYLLRA